MKLRLHPQASYITAREIAGLGGEEVIKQPGRFQVTNPSEGKAGHHVIGLNK
tara:strand:+ start:518 stop:673 length:156 start_codon:yes stop_codon:yes gene_type:complete